MALEGARNQAQNNARKVAGSVSSFKNDFVKFINKGNVVDLAVGLVVGTAFTAIVTSLTQDIIGPIIGLIIGSSLKESFVVIKRPNSTVVDYKTRDDASKDGAVTLNYGNFIQTIMNFFIIAFCMFLMVKVLLKFRREKKADEPKLTCNYCKTDNHVDATRCKACTSELAHNPDVAGSNSSQISSSGSTLHQRSK